LVGGDQLAITVNYVAEIVERLAWLDRNKVHQTIAENRVKAQASALADAPLPKTQALFVVCVRTTITSHEHEVMRNANRSRFAWVNF